MHKKRLKSPCGVMQEWRERILEESRAKKYPLILNFDEDDWDDKYPSVYLDDLYVHRDNAAIALANHDLAFFPSLANTRPPPFVLILRTTRFEVRQIHQ